MSFFKPLFLYSGPPPFSLSENLHSPHLFLSLTICQTMSFSLTLYSSILVLLLFFPFSNNLYLFSIVSYSILYSVHLLPSLTICQAMSFYLTLHSSILVSLILPPSLTTCTYLQLSLTLFYTLSIFCLLLQYVVHSNP